MIACVVLCGGESQRMGRPKAWLPIGPERLLQRVVRQVASAASPIIVVAAPGQELPDLPAEVVVVRDPVSYQGPLFGLLAGFEALPDAVELVYVTATDLPFFTPAWLDFLSRSIGDADLAIPFVDGHHHPLSALYRRSTALPAIRGLIESARFRPYFLIETLNTRVITADELLGVDPSLATLRNVNTPEEYREALRIAGFEDENC